MGRLHDSEVTVGTTRKDRKGARVTDHVYDAMPASLEV